MKQNNFLNNNNNNLKIDSIQTITNKTIKKKYNIHREKISKEFSHKRISMISEPIEINNKIKFKESDFSFEFTSKNKNIISLELNDLINLNYNNLELKYYFFSLRKISIKGQSNLILENISNEKINFFFNILFDENINNLTIEEFLKFKYEILIILIDLNVDSEDFNEIFIKNTQNIFNFIIKIINFNNINNENNPYLIILYHLIWLFSNIISDDEIFNIIIKNENIKIPFLIKNIFDLKILKILNPTFELFFNFLERIEDENFIIENKFFIEYFSNIIQFCLNEFQIDLLFVIFKTLKLFLKKKEICDFILFNFHKFKNLIEIILNCYKLYDKSKCCLKNLLKNDNNFFLINQYEKIIFYDFVLNYISNDNNYNKNNLKIIKHAIKILIILIDSEKILNFFINENKLFGNINRIYIQFNDFSLIFNIFSFYDKIFEKGNLIIKKILIDKKLHIFCIEELPKFIDYYENKNNNKYIDKIIFNILTILKKILLISNEIEITLNKIKEDLDERGFYDFLIKLQENKNSNIYDFAIDIIENFYEGDY